MEKWKLDEHFFMVLKHSISSDSKTTATQPGFDFQHRLEFSTNLFELPVASETDSFEPTLVRYLAAKKYYVTGTKFE